MLKKEKIIKTSLTLASEAKNPPLMENSRIKKNSNDMILQILNLSYIVRYERNVFLFKVAGETIKLVRR